MRGGDPEPKPKPSPVTGKIVPPDAPFPEPPGIKAVAPGGGIPGGPRGEVSATARMPPNGGPLGPGGAPAGRIGPRPPRPRVLAPPMPDCWLMLGGGPTGPGPWVGWPTGYIPYWCDTFGSYGVRFL